MDGHVCCKLRNSLGGYGGIRVVRVSDDLGGSSSRGWGGVVAKSAVVPSRWCVKNPSEFRWVLMAVAWLSFHASVGQSDAFEDFHCLNSYLLAQGGSGNFLGGKFMIGWKRVFCLCELISCILANKPSAEPLAQRHILFIVSAAAVSLPPVECYPSPATGMFFEWNRKSGDIWILLNNTANSLSWKTFHRLETCWLSSKEKFWAQQSVKRVVLTDIFTRTR